MSKASNTAEEPRFVRDRLTWLGYLLSATPAYAFGAFGPIMPFLRGELGLNFTTAAYHFTALAAGGAVAGMSGRTVVGGLGRQRAMWCAAALFVVALIVLITAHAPAVTICSALAIGCSASLIGQCVASVMSDRFGDERTIGFLEQNITSSTLCLIAPIAVWCVITSGLTWRAAFVPPIVSIVCLYSIFGREKISDTLEASKGETLQTRLPLAFWTYWSVILLSVAAEWSIIFWSAEFLHDSVHVSKADAGAATTTFLVSMLLGRIAGRLLSHRFSAQQLLPMSAAVALGGFLMFWLGPSLPVKLAGLLITGFGNSNIFPLTYSAALATSPRQSTVAAARIAMSTSTAVISAPLVLGSIADHSGLFTAFAAIGSLFTVCSGMTLVANHTGAKHTRSLNSAAAIVPAGEPPLS